MLNEKMAEWDKTSNEKMSNGTKRRIENRKEKYIYKYFWFFITTNIY